jgi:hypothetical protein
VKLDQQINPQWIACGIFVAIFATIAVMCMGAGNGTYTTPGLAMDNPGAYAAALDIVGRHLKAPSTASYSGYTETRVSKSGDQWTVQGHVDAQNEFGAMLRKPWVVIFQDAGGRTTPIFVNVGGEVLLDSTTK